MNQRNDIPDWLLSVQGRIARIVVGSLLIILGLGVIGGFLGVLLFIIGAVPIGSAAYGTLLVGPLFGRDIRGRRPAEQPDEEGDDEPEEEEAGDEQPRSQDGEERSESGEEEPRSEGNAEDRSESGDGSRGGKAAGEGIAPPLARAERPPGQGPRTKDPRADEPAGSEDDSQQ